MIPIAKKSRSIIGLDIGASSVKLVWLHKKGPAVQLLGAAIKHFSKEQTNNAVSELIKSGLSQAGCAAKAVFLCVNNSNICIRRMSFVSMPEEELREAVKLAIKDEAEIDLEKAVVNYQILSQGKNEQGTPQTHILAASAEKKFIYDSINIARQAGLEVKGISLGPFVLGRIFDIGTIAVLDIGASKAEFTLFKDGIPQFSRLLPGAGNEFTKGMTDVLISTCGRLELNYNEAENLKIDIGIPQKEEGTVKNGISSAQLSSIYRPVLEKLTSEIKHSLEYCKVQLGLSAPDKIYLTGGGSLLKGLDKSLSRSLNIQVLLSDFLSGPFKDRIGLEYSEKVRQDISNPVFFDNAIAAALDEAERADLLPLEFKQQRKRAIERIFLRMGIIISVLAVAAPYLYITAHIQYIKSQIKIARANYETVHEVVFIKDAIKGKKELLGKLNRGHCKAAIILNTISRVIHPSVELTSLACKEDGEIYIEGKVISAQPETALTDFIKSMQNNADIFKGIKITSFAKGTQKDSVSKFAMSCEVFKEAGL